MNSPFVLARIAAAALFAATSIGLLASGSHAPPWVLRLGDLAGIGPASGLRVAAGIFLAFALGTLLFRRVGRWVALIGLALVAFASLATLSAMSIIDAPLIVVSAGALGAAVGLFLWIKALPNPMARVGPSPAWTVLGGIAIATAGLAAAASSPMRAIDRVRSDLPRAPGGQPYVDLGFDRWDGQRLASTSLATHLPAAIARIEADPTRSGWLVFYSPRCGSCHDLFREHFAGERTETIVAIEIPPPPDATVLESDQPESIDCPSCQHLSLGTGSGWLITPPTVIRVEGGIVHCVSEPGQDRNCFEP